MEHKCNILLDKLRVKKFTNGAQEAQERRDKHGGTYHSMYTAA